eukprot:TRINITY_DN14530_c0_g1_i1.p1 TRINITY_DN14530_c0_g1~~TRINITY_DN14530_c0_g1_i1.p1  ORF type:complete len:502 (-),score=108.22 TRINITY_DN14530_c0_g1_i1:75-1556(-)
MDIGLDRLQLVLQLQNVSSLDSDSCKRILHKYDWDVEQAVEYFLSFGDSSQCPEVGSSAREELTIPESIQPYLSDKSLYKQAITHSSASRDNYERLEFLGDRVLELVVSEFIYTNSTRLTPGMMTDMKSEVVKNLSLEPAALRLGLDKHIIRNVRELPPKVLADVFEAIIGAIYITRGAEDARKFVLIQLREELDIVKHIDFISLRDQIRNLNHHHNLEVLKLPFTSNEFKSTITLTSFMTSSATSPNSAEEATTIAAREALERLKNKSDLIPSCLQFYSISEHLGRLEHLVNLMALELSFNIIPLETNSTRQFECNATLMSYKGPHGKLILVDFGKDVTEEGAKRNAAQKILEKITSRVFIEQVITGLEVNPVEALRKVCKEVFAKEMEVKISKDEGFRAQVVVKGGGKVIATSGYHKGMMLAMKDAVERAERVVGLKGEGLEEEKGEDEDDWQERLSNFLITEANGGGSRGGGNNRGRGNYRKKKGRGRGK